MAAFLSILFLISLLAMWPLAIAYYFALHKFGNAVQSLHPGVVADFRAQERIPRSSFSRSYAILRAVETGKSFDEPLSNQVMAQYKSTRTLLYSAAVAFLLLLFSGLAQELVV